jgi:hypothetical protein
MSQQPNPTPSRTTIPPDSALGLLLDYWREQKIPNDALGSIEGMFEEAGQSADGTLPLWTPVELKSEEQIRWFNKKLLDGVWHMRDYILEYAMENHGKTEDQAVAMTKAIEDQNVNLQVCGYLANKGKHGRVRKFRFFKKDPNPPKLGDVAVHFILPNGVTGIDGDLIGAQDIKMTSKLPYRQTVKIENSKGAKEDTRRLAEAAAEAWLDLLITLGVNLPRPAKPDPNTSGEPIHEIHVGGGPPRRLPGYIPFVASSIWNARVLRRRRSIDHVSLGAQVP